MTSAHVTHKQEAVTSHCRKTQTRPSTEVNKYNDVQQTPYLCVIIIKLAADEFFCKRGVARARDWHEADDKNVFLLHNLASIHH